MKFITSEDQDWLKKALHTDKEVKIRGKWIIPESGVPPYPLLRLIAFDDYPVIKDDKTVSVTTLNVPHKINWFVRKMPDEMVFDIGQAMAAIIGTSIHLYAEKANKHFGKGDTELMLSADVGEYKLRGILDLVEDGLNADYKTATMSFVNKPEDKPEYIRQTQMQMWLAKKNNITVDRSYIATIGRDYSGAMKMQGIDCFWGSDWQHHIYEYDEGIDNWIHERVHQFFDTMKVDNQDDLPECTKEEMWQRDESWGIYKTNNGVPNKRVVNGGRFYTKFNGDAAESMAQSKASQLGLGHKVIYKPGVNVRCESWCPARLICKQKMRNDQLALNNA